MYFLLKLVNSAGNEVCSLSKTAGNGFNLHHCSKMFLSYVIKVSSQMQRQVEL